MNKLGHKMSAYFDCTILRKMQTIWDDGKVFLIVGKKQINVDDKMQNRKNDH